MAILMLKIGELILKKGNRHIFEKILRQNIRKALKPIKNRLESQHGRLYITVDAEHRQQAIDRLRSVMGINAVVQAQTMDKNMETIINCACGEAAAFLAEKRTHSRQPVAFKVAARRNDKSFKYDSYQICSRVGEAILQRFADDFSVNLKEPELTINIEVRNRATVYSREYRSVGGLPVSSTGRAILLLSGGIDSPAAGYCMAKRGLKIEPLYFHSPPYTSSQALDKVKKLTSILAPWFGGTRLHVANLTPVQLEIRKKAATAETTLLMRAAMIEAAALLAEKRWAQALLSGEALSQVASQTIGALRFTASITDLPVLRPLIGMNKEEIIIIARKIDTYSTSILPYDDCCALFSPPNPLINPDFDNIRHSYRQLALTPLIEKMVGECVSFNYNNIGESFSRNAGVKNGG